jgi:hypothetical protein
MRRHGNATSKRRTEKLITPDAKTERSVSSLGRPIPDISRRTQNWQGDPEKLPRTAPLNRGPLAD